MTMTVTVFDLIPTGPHGPHGAYGPKHFYQSTYTRRQSKHRSDIQGSKISRLRIQCYVGL